MADTPTAPDASLPELPKPWTAASTLKCTRCGAPYDPMRRLTPMASAALFSGTPLYHGCKCGCAQFEGTFGYDSPSPAKFTADQMRAYALTHAATIRAEVERLTRAGSDAALASSLAVRTCVEAVENMQTELAALKAAQPDVEVLMKLADEYADAAQRGDDARSIAGKCAALRTALAARKEGL